MPVQLRALIPDPFVCAMIAAIALATQVPAYPPYDDAVQNFAYCAIMLLFFLHGARLSRDAIISGLANWRLQLSIFATTFLVFPLIGIGFVQALPGLLDPGLATGVLFLCVVPSTVQSSVAFASVGGGNVPAAIAAAACSNIIGVLLSPILMGFLVSVHASGAEVGNAGRIIVLLLLPFLIGQMARPWLGDKMTRYKSLVTLCDRATIVLAVYSAFSAAVIGGVWSRVGLSDLGLLLSVIIALFLAMSAAVWRTSRWFGFTQGDRITMLTCASQKSLASGVPMAAVLFGGAAAGAIVLPLMIYHQTQLVLGSFIIRRLAKVGTQTADQIDPAASGVGNG